MSYLLACYNVKCVKIDFKNEEQLTETMATMSSADIKEFGYSLNDIVLDCKFAGSNCDPSWVFAWFLQNKTVGSK